MLFSVNEPHTVCLLHITESLPLQLALNRWTWAYRDSFSSSPPVHPVHPPPPASCLLSLGDDDEDDKCCQHSGCYQEATSKDQHRFVLEHPRTCRARFVQPTELAGLCSVILGETAASDDFSVDGDGGFGFGLVVGRGEEAKLGGMSILQLPHVEALQVDSI